jgi:uncharacterized membrane protein YuzA (DUF378 family)
VGGLNWGLVAIAEFDLVAGIVGLAAAYQIAQQAAIRRRWSAVTAYARKEPPQMTRIALIVLAALALTVPVATAAALPC